VKGCLYTVDKEGLRQDFTKENTFSDQTSFVRYITPLECERLQTLPDGYTACVSNTQRYKMLGNGWTVDIIAHILAGMNR
jgi:site-specific DNA-cytosine methylase